jgi:hypothetical protein
MRTGRENLRLVGRLYHLGRAGRRQRAGQVLEQVQLAGTADRPVRTYSGGTRRRPCPRTWSQGRRPNDKSLPARPGRETLGRSRGGLGTKIHLAADRLCRLVSRILRSGQHGDCPRIIPLTDAVPSAAGVWGGPVPGPAPRLLTRPTPPRSTAPTCASAGSRRSFRRRKTRRERRRARGSAGGRPPHLRRRALQRAQHRQALFLQEQAVPRRRAPVRQARAHLPGHRRRRVDPELATGSRPLTHGTRPGA